MSQDDEKRLREKPKQRFAPDERKIDLEEATKELLSEERGQTRGHRQINLTKDKHQSILLFHFNEGAELPEHDVDGQVTIKVLDGHLEIDTDQTTHSLETNQLLVLKPNVEHGVRALEESKMLLIIHLRTNDGEFKP
jgi:quercetin dioxygenase-like cupin family protein